MGEEEIVGSPTYTYTEYSVCSDSHAIGKADAEKTACFSSINFYYNS